MEYLIQALKKSEEKHLEFVLYANLALRKSTGSYAV